MIAALRDLLARATPGPWEVETYGSGQANVTMPRGRSIHFPPFATVYGNAGVATTLADGTVVGMSGHDLDGLSEAEYDRQRFYDATAIAKLRNAAPALLDIAAAVMAYGDAVDKRESFHVLDNDSPEYAAASVAETNAYRAMLAALDALETDK